MMEQTNLPPPPEAGDTEELPDDLYEQVTELSEHGNGLLDAGDPAGALRVWSEALLRLPPPHSRWDAAIWLYGSMAEAHYLQEGFAEACDAIRQALAIAAGDANPWLHYMHGKALQRMGDAGAADALLRAYMLDGRDIFDEDGDEGGVMLALLRDRGLLDE